MNNVGEYLDVTSKVSQCRVFDPKETLQQLRTLTPVKFMCWGASKFTVDNMKNCRMLQFNVNGMLHKGLVTMFLNSSDLYDVYIHDKKGLIKSLGTDLYFDMVGDWIDEKIEKVSGYSF